MNRYFTGALIVGALGVGNVAIAFVGRFTPLNLASGLACCVGALIYVRDGLRARAVRQARDRFWSNLERERTTRR
jgi:hypothetical protein